MLELVLEYRIAAQFYAGLIICFAALRWGSMPERSVALVWLIVFECGDLVYDIFVGPRTNLHRVDLWYAFIDLTAATILVGVALFANRMYTIWIAAFQLVSVSSHLSRELVEVMTPISYYVLAVGPSYFQLALLLGGLIFHVRRKKIWGEYRDWRKPLSQE